MGTTSEKKKQTRKYIMWAVSALVVLALAVLPMLAAGKNSAETQASILSVTMTSAPGFPCQRLMGQCWEPGSYTFPVRGMSPLILALFLPYGSRREIRCP